ncbi:MAG: transposase [Deltaproteobacteria bacterium]|nr:transposase [Deltaproteobacteria bacterium]
MPRQARLDSPGTLHHVMVRGIECGEIVRDVKDRREFVRRMGTLAEDTGTKIFAWALMSNHAHILLRSGPKGLPRYMRRLLSSYAIYYNKIHQRHGHLFQNRYKSIVCEEDPYFMELVRYIHLNPLRAKVIPSLARLDDYPWCGHSVILGLRKRPWQDEGYVLKWFGSRKYYRDFVRQGIKLGSRPELVGGGLIRSQGGWSAVKGMRKSGVEEKGDERILGSGEFVDRLLADAEEEIKRQLPPRELARKVRETIEDACARKKISRDILLSGSRRRFVSAVRAELARKLVEDIGISMAECARQIGVTTTGVAQILRRSKYIK